MTSKYSSGMAELIFLSGGDLPSHPQKMYLSDILTGMLSLAVVTFALVIYRSRHQFITASRKIFCYLIQHFKLSRENSSSVYYLSTSFNFYAAILLPAVKMLYPMSSMSNLFQSALRWWLSHIPFLKTKDCSKDVKVVKSSSCSEVGGTVEGLIVQNLAKNTNDLSQDSSVTFFRKNLPPSSFSVHGADFKFVEFPLTAGEDPKQETMAGKQKTVSNPGLRQTDHLSGGDQRYENKDGDDNKDENDALHQDTVQNSLVSETLCQQANKNVKGVSTTDESSTERDSPDSERNFRRLRNFSWDLEVTTSSSIKIDDTESKLKETILDQLDTDKSQNDSLHFEPLNSRGRYSHSKHNVVGTSEFAYSLLQARLQKKRHNFTKPPCVILEPRDSDFVPTPLPTEPLYQNQRGSLLNKRKNAKEPSSHRAIIVKDSYFGGPGLHSLKRRRGVGVEETEVHKTGHSFDVHLKENAHEKKHVSRRSHETQPCIIPSHESTDTLDYTKHSPGQLGTYDTLRSLQGKKRKQERKQRKDAYTGFHKDVKSTVDNYNPQFDEKMTVAPKNKANKPLILESIRMVESLRSSSDASQKSQAVEKREDFLKTTHESPIGQRSPLSSADLLLEKSKAIGEKYKAKHPTRPTLLLNIRNDCGKTTQHGFDTKRRVDVSRIKKPRLLRADASSLMNSSCEPLYSSTDVKDKCQDSFTLRKSKTFLSVSPTDLNTKEKLERSYIVFKKEISMYSGHMVTNENSTNPSDGKEISEIRSCHQNIPEPKYLPREKSSPSKEILKDDANNGEKHLENQTRNRHNSETNYSPKEKVSQKVADLAKSVKKNNAEQGKKIPVKHTAAKTKTKNRSSLLPRLKTLKRKVENTSRRWKTKFPSSEPKKKQDIDENKACGQTYVANMQDRTACSGISCKSFIPRLITPSRNITSKDARDSNRTCTVLDANKEHSEKDSKNQETLKKVPLGVTSSKTVKRPLLDIDTAARNKIVQEAGIEKNDTFHERTNSKSLLEFLKRSSPRRETKSSTNNSPHKTQQKMEEIKSDVSANSPMLSSPTALQNIGQNATNLEFLRQLVEKQASSSCLTFKEDHKSKHSISHTDKESSNGNHTIVNRFSLCRTQHTDRKSVIPRPKSGSIYQKPNFDSGRSFSAGPLGKSAEHSARKLRLKADFSGSTSESFAPWENYITHDELSQDLERIRKCILHNVLPKKELQRKEFSPYYMPIRSYTSPLCPRSFETVSHKTSPFCKMSHTPSSHLSSPALNNLTTIYEKKFSINNFSPESTPDLLPHHQNKQVGVSKSEINKKLIHILKMHPSRGKSPSTRNQKLDINGHAYKNKETPVLKPSNVNLSDSSPPKRSAQPYKTALKLFESPPENKKLKNVTSDVEKGDNVKEATTKAKCARGLKYFGPSVNGQPIDRAINQKENTHCLKEIGDETKDPVNLPFCAPPRCDCVYKSPNGEPLNVEKTSLESNHLDSVAQPKIPSLEKRRKRRCLMPLLRAEKRVKNKILQRKNKIIESLKEKEAVKNDLIRGNAFHGIKKGPKPATDKSRETAIGQQKKDKGHKDSPSSIHRTGVVKASPPSTTKRKSSAVFTKNNPQNIQQTSHHKKETDSSLKHEPISDEHSVSQNEQEKSSKTYLIFKEKDSMIKPDQQTDGTSTNQFETTMKQMPQVHKQIHEPGKAGEKDVCHQIRNLQTVSTNRSKTNLKLLLTKSPEDDNVKTKTDCENNSNYDAISSTIVSLRDSSNLGKQILALSPLMNTVLALKCMMFTFSGVIPIARVDKSIVNALTSFRFLRSNSGPSSDTIFRQQPDFASDARSSLAKILNSQRTQETKEACLTNATPYSFRGRSNAVSLVHINFEYNCSVEEQKASVAVVPQSVPSISSCSEVSTTKKAKVESTSPVSTDICFLDSRVIVASDPHKCFTVSDIESLTDSRDSQTPSPNTEADKQYKETFDEDDFGVKKGVSTKVLEILGSRVNNSHTVPIRDLGQELKTVETKKIVSSFLEKKHSESSQPSYNENKVCSEQKTQNASRQDKEASTQEPKQNRKSEDNRRTVKRTPQIRVSARKVITKLTSPAKTVSGFPLKYGDRRRTTPIKHHKKTSLTGDSSSCCCCSHKFHSVPKKSVCHKKRGDSKPKNLFDFKGFPKDGKSPRYKRSNQKLSTKREAELDKTGQGSKRFKMKELLQQDDQLKVASLGNGDTEKSKPMSSTTKDLEALLDSEIKKSFTDSKSARIPIFSASSDRRSRRRRRGQISSQRESDVTSVSLTSESISQSNYESPQRCNLLPSFLHARLDEYIKKRTSKKCSDILTDYHSTDVDSVPSLTTVSAFEENTLNNYLLGRGLFTHRRVRQNHTIDGPVQQTLYKQEGNIQGAKCPSGRRNTLSSQNEHVSMGKKKVDRQKERNENKSLVQSISNEAKNTESTGARDDSKKTVSPTQAMSHSNKDSNKYIQPNKSPLPSPRSNEEGVFCGSAENQHGELFEEKTSINCGKTTVDKGSEDSTLKSRAKQRSPRMCNKDHSPGRDRELISSPGKLSSKKSLTKDNEDEEKVSSVSSHSSSEIVLSWVGSSCSDVEDNEDELKLCPGPSVDNDPKKIESIAKVQEEHRKEEAMSKNKENGIKQVPVEHTHTVPNITGFEVWSGTSRFDGWSKNCGPDVTQDLSIDPCFTDSHLHNTINSSSIVFSSSYIGDSLLDFALSGQEQGDAIDTMLNSLSTEESESFSTCTKPNVSKMKNTYRAGARLQTALKNNMASREAQKGYFESYSNRYTSSKNFHFQSHHLENRPRVSLEEHLRTRVNISDHTPNANVDGRHEQKKDDLDVCMNKNFGDGLPRADENVSPPDLYHHHAPSLEQHLASGNNIHIAEQELSRSTSSQISLNWYKPHSIHSGSSGHTALITAPLSEPPPNQETETAEDSVQQAVNEEQEERPLGATAISDPECGRGADLGNYNNVAKDLNTEQRPHTNVYRKPEALFKSECKACHTLLSQSPNIFRNAEDTRPPPQVVLDLRGIPTSLATFTHRPASKNISETNASKLLKLPDSSPHWSRPGGSNINSYETDWSKSSEKDLIDQGSAYIETAPTPQDQRTKHLCKTSLINTPESNIKITVSCSKSCLNSHNLRETPKNQQTEKLIPIQHGTVKTILKSLNKPTVSTPPKPIKTTLELHIKPPMSLTSRHLERPTRHLWPPPSFRTQAEDRGETGKEVKNFITGHERERQSKETTSSVSKMVEMFEKFTGKDK